jgi:hypothetical protein
LAGSLSASAVVLVDESGIVTGINGLQITGGGLDGVYDVRFSSFDLASVLIELPSQLPLYDNPGYSGMNAAQAVTLSITQALNAGGHHAVQDGTIDGNNRFVVPYASVPEQLPSRFSVGFYAFNSNSPGPASPNWTPPVSGSPLLEFSDFQPNVPLVLMQPSAGSPAVPEPETFAWVSGVMLAGFAFWRHRRTS